MYEKVSESSPKSSPKSSPSPVQSLVQVQSKAKSSPKSSPSPVRSLVQVQSEVSPVQAIVKNGLACPRPLAIMELHVHPAPVKDDQNTSSDAPHPAERCDRSGRCREL